MFQNLKRQHVALSEQVKLAFQSFPGLEVLKSVQLLGKRLHVPKIEYNLWLGFLLECFFGLWLGAEYEILKRKYLEVSLERRRLNNEVIELKGNIRVFCRCRPLNENEIANGSAVSVVNFESNSEELQVVCSDSSKKQFKFDHVFKPEDNQGTWEIIIFL